MVRALVAWWTTPPASRGAFVLRVAAEVVVLLGAFALLWHFWPAASRWVPYLEQ